VISSSASALDFDLGEFGFSLINRASLGGQWRIEDRDPALIGKLNLDPTLCAGDDCHSFAFDPEPNQRLVDAPGAFSGDKFDDGNLNYDRGDLVAGVAKLTTDFQANWRNFYLKARTIAFFDQINTDFQDFHPNNDSVVSPGVGGYQPEFTQREDAVEDLIGNNVDLLDLVLSAEFFIGDRALGVAVGQQKLRWGEANLIALNSINEINPPDARRLRMPGAQINEVFIPVPMAVLTGDLFPDQGITAELFYQWSWEPVQADIGGTFFGDTDFLYREGAANHVLFNLGYFPEDPLVEQDGRLRGRHRLQTPVGALLTDTSFTLQLDQSVRARDEGQFGVRVNWFADFINNGTEFGFYAMQYHSRFPYLSAFAADRTPLRTPITGSAVDVLLTCRLAQNDCLPLDSVRTVLEYPEDIHLFGLSFNTNVGSWSLAGEYSFRPNLPVQIHGSDVLWSAMQPAFPENDIPIGASTIDDLLGTGELFGTLGFPVEQILNVLLDPVFQQTLELPVIIPGARSALPDFVETIYRGNTDIDAKIAADGENYYIPGFERLKVGQFAMTGIRILGSSNPLASLVRTEQIITLIEVGFTHIVDMPPLDQIQFDVPTPNRTHASGGADGTGQVDGLPDPRSYNPTQQTEAFVTDFSWGYRILSMLEYNDVIWGLNFKPFLSWFHDVQGYAPGPMANFLEDRKEWMVGTEIFYGEQWSAKLQYNGLDGNRHFARRDRDTVLAEIHYTF
jgi:hypothetical protein